MALSESRKAQNADTIGVLVRASREKAGYTQKALADAIGLEYYTMISQMEKGYVTVPVALWLPLADVLHLDRAEFVCRCLASYMPDHFHALFGSRGVKEAAAAIDAFQKGRLDEILFGNKDAALD